MWCAECRTDVADCVCPDLEQRLDSVSFLVYRKCRRCQKHYARCRCDDPVWGTNLDIKSTPESAV